MQCIKLHGKHLVYRKDNGSKQIIKQKNGAYRKWLSNNNQEHWIEYKKIQKKVRKRVIEEKT